MLPCDSRSTSLIHHCWLQDYPGEFFADMKKGVLYLNYNGTGAPPADMEVVVPQKQVLLNASGTQWNPVTNVNFKGITYTASAHT